MLVRHIELLDLPEAFAEQAGVLHTPQFMSNFSKLRMWEFCDEYDKLVYLDSDVIPMQNIDDMFMAPHFSAAQDNMVPDEGFDAERCQAPSLHMKAPWQTKSAYFNAGVFVFEPSLEELSEIMKTLKHSKLTRCAEQDLLNEFYAGRWNMLPMSYNWGRVNFFVNPEICPPAALKIVHFSGPAKPWRRHADRSWPEAAYAMKLNKQEVRQIKYKDSPFNRFVDRWWEVFRLMTGSDLGLNGAGNVLRSQDKAAAIKPRSCQASSSAPAAPAALADCAWREGGWQCHTHCWRHSSYTATAA